VNTVHVLVPASWIAWQFRHLIVVETEEMLGDVLKSQLVCEFDVLLLW
jgi:hypothetical protein